MGGYPVAATAGVLALFWGTRAEACLLAFAVFWCIVIVRRLPKDIVELRDLWRTYRDRDEPTVLARLETAQRRRSHRAECAREFWGTLTTHVLFFWPLTVVAAAFLALYVSALL